MSETTYQFTRENLAAGDNSGLWDVDNPDRVSGDPSTQLHLAKEIEAALPGKLFKVRNFGAICNVIFSEALSVEEEATLTTTVNNHKSNA